MFGFAKKKDKRIPILATQTGILVRLEEVPDDVFAQKILGEGVAVIPSECTTCSPVSGTVTYLADTLHAICITTDDGAEILVHIGIDTCKLNGESFHSLIKSGDQIKAGQPIVNVDIATIIEKGFQMHTPTVITNAENYYIYLEPVTKVVGGQTVVAYYEHK